MKPQDILKISEPIEKMYMDCSSQLIINLSRHFATDKALPSREWEIKKLGELGQLTNESIEIIAYNTGQSKEAIKQAITEALVQEVSPLEKKLRDAAKKGFIQGNNLVLGAPEDTQNILASESIITVLQNLVDQATEDTNVVNTVMLQSVRNNYVNAIANTLEEEQKEIEKLQSAANLASLDAQLQQTQTALNTSAFSVASGAEARTTALRRTIGALAAQGITGYVDAGGHHWSPEAYINMDIRTTAHNAAIQGQKARSADYGVETFQVSTHRGARPLCAPYQGKFYSWGGDSGYVYDIDGKAHRYESIFSTSYGEPAGLFGINCGHFPETFISGYSTPRYEPTEDEEENNREYQESQQQRAIERDIRKYKTEALSYQAAGDQEGFEKAALKVKQKQADYKSFCKDTGRTPRNDRTQVFGYDRSTAAKARAAAKDYTPTTKAPTAHVFGDKAKLLIDDLERRGVDRLPLKKLTTELTTEQIITKLGGGDMTEGSCASLAMAWIGNRGGYDVNDFRGGKSRAFFAQKAVSRTIADFDGVVKYYATGTNDITNVHKVIKNMEDSKEYYLSTASHAAIIRNTGGMLEYLELQSARSNGYKPLNDDVLRWRFGCQKSHSHYGVKYEVKSLLIDIDTVKGNDDFIGLMEYLNTATDKQLKSESGTIK